MRICSLQKILETFLAKLLEKQNIQRNQKKLVEDDNDCVIGSEYTVHEPF